MPSISQPSTVSKKMRVKRVKRFRKKIIATKYRTKRSARNVIKSSASTKVGSTMLVASRSPIPPTMQVKFRYAQTVTYTTGAAGIVGVPNTFRLSNLFDPDLTGTGHQPYGWDQIRTFYKNYKVESVSVVLIWSTIGGTAEVMPCYSITSETNGVSLSGISCDYATELPSVSTCILSASGNTRTVEQRFSAPLYKIHAIKKSEYNQPEYTAQDNNVATEPTKQVYLAVSVGSPSGVGGIAATCQTIITYNVRCTGRIQMGQS